MKKLIAGLLAASVLTPVAASAEGLTRVLTVPLKAEITGLYEHGSDLFMNIQHPDAKIDGPYSKATVGVIANVNWAAGEQAAPSTDAEKIGVMSTLGAYQTLLQEGDMGVVGVINTAGGEGLLVSNDPDFNGFIPTGENEGFLFTNWENTPGGMSRAKLSRAADGTWSVAEGSVSMVDFSAVNGTWINCFGTVSPWNTPLSSEELYFDDTAEWNNVEYKEHEDVAALASHLGQFPNPYDYGYIIEMKNPTGDVRPVKHFSMGRFSHENSVVMPDNKTVYLSDDGTGVVFFKFVADKAGDLSAGTLFAAKIKQLGEAGASAADTALQISWIELAHGSNAEIEGWVRQYDGIGTDKYEAGKTSYITDEEVAAWAAGDAADNRVAFLESRKAAVAKGATGEFRKMEGVNINFAGAKDGSVPFMVMAMSSIGKTMSDGEGDIDLAENKCGVVYEMKLDANFNVSKMVPLVAGHGYDKANKPNACPVGSISNPDNVLVLGNGDVLIGEDTSNHENNALWVYRK